jgi:hypothetical protein
MAVPRGWLLVLILCALALPRPVAASPVNAEVLRPDALAPGWSGGLDGSLALARGNVVLTDVGGAARVQLQTLHRPRPDLSALPFVHQRVLATGSGRFAAQRGRAFVSQAFAHARWTAMWHPIVGSDVFAQHQTNAFLRLRARTIAGTGVRVVLVHAPMIMIWAGSGWMIERERIDVQPGARDRPVTLAHRSTSYFTVRAALFRDRLLAQNTVYWQPRFDAPTDVRALEELELLAKVTDVLALGLTFGLAYDSAPPTGVAPTDLRLASTVRLSFHGLPARRRDRVSSPDP